MSQRLNNRLREEIKAAAMEDAFGKRREALDKRERELGWQSRDRLAGGHLTAWLGLPLFLRRIDSCHRQCVTVNGQRHLLRLPKNVDGISEELRLGADDDLGAEIEKLAQDQKQLKDEEGNLRAKLEGILHSVSSVKRLLEVWPEARPYVPTTETQTKAMVGVDDLNKAIQRAKAGA